MSQKLPFFLEEISHHSVFNGTYISGP